MNDQRRAAFEALVLSDMKTLARMGKITPEAAIEKMSEAVREGAVGQDILEKDRALMLDVLGDLLTVDAIYRQVNLKRTTDTEPAFTDAQVLEVSQQTEDGDFSTVYALRVEAADGTESDVLFKPISQDHQSFAGLKTGIPKDDPQTAMRNLATVAYAEKLGFHVVVHTRVALATVGRHPFGPTLGLAMERAPGVPAEQADSSVFERADVCAEVTKLQLLDHLTGEGERHALNYFIHIGQDDRPTVMGIDNEECFGKYLTDPAGARWADNVRRMGFRGVGLPAVVDTEMERAIHAMTKDDIRSMLGNKLAPAEISAAIQRYKGVTAHLEKLRRQNRIIEPDQWGNPAVQGLLTPENSYFARDRH